MGRVTFEGPIKSNSGFESGETGSRSNLAGTVIISTAGSITISCGSLNSTTNVVSGNQTISGDTAITGDLSVGAGTTVATISIAAATNNDIKINSAVTGLGAGTFHTITLTPGATVSMNCNNHSVFYCTNTSTSGYKIMPVGGYVGQLVTLIWESQSSSSIVFASSASLAMRMTGAVTGWAGLAGSHNALVFLNVGPGLETPTTQSLLLQEYYRPLPITYLRLHFLVHL